MKKQPEEHFLVEVTRSDEIVCRERSVEQRTSIADLGAVYFETSDDAIFGFDWWLLINKAGEVAVAFPLGATGEQAALERLRCSPALKSME